MNHPDGLEQRTADLEERIAEREESEDDEDDDAPVILTEYVHPPIPTRECDWQAVTENYDGPGSPIGHGRTEQAAIDDLLEQLQP